MQADIAVSLLCFASSWLGRYTEKAFTVQCNNIIQITNSGISSHSEGIKRLLLESHFAAHVQGYKFEFPAFKIWRTQDFPRGDDSPRRISFHGSQDLLDWISISSSPSAVSLLNFISPLIVSSTSFLSKTLLNISDWNKNGF